MGMGVSGAVTRDCVIRYWMSPCRPVSSVGWGAFTPVASIRVPCCNSSGKRPAGQTIPGSLRFIGSEKPAVDRRALVVDNADDVMATSEWGNRNAGIGSSRVGHHGGCCASYVHGGEPDTAATVDSTGSSVAAAAPQVDACAQARWEEAFAGGFALVRGVSFQGFFTHVANPVPTNQQMP